MAIRSTSASSARGPSPSRRSFFPRASSADLQLVDRDEADDKIIAVLQGDYVWGDAHDLSDVPSVLIERLEHYFSTYKLVPSEPAQIRLAGSYGSAHAHSVVQAAMEDYDELFGARA